MTPADFAIAIFLGVGLLLLAVGLAHAWRRVRLARLRRDVAAFNASHEHAPGSRAASSPRGSSRPPSRAT